MTKATDKYKMENYDRIAFPMAKGAKAVIKEHCKMTEEPYQAFLRRAVMNQIEYDRCKEYIKGGRVLNTIIRAYSNSVKGDTILPLDEWLTENFCDLAPSSLNVLNPPESD